MRLIMLGAPGSGKGTQAQKLTQQYNIPQISTGDIFRKNMREGTPLGIQVKSIIEAGGLVPDEITIAIVVDRLAQDDCKEGFIMDGFPRSIPQAEAFDKLVSVDKVVNLIVDNNVILHRMTGRRTCKSCQGVFHIDQVGNGNCPKCQGELFTRADDEAETVKNRLQVYENTTKPLVEYYSRQGKIVNVDSNQDVEKVFYDILEALK